MPCTAKGRRRYRSRSYAKRSRRKIRTICFCRARQEVERLYRAVIDDRPDLAQRSSSRTAAGSSRTSGARSSATLQRDRYAPSSPPTRSSSGIDIGDLDLCILSGHPGTIASFWQQAGRVGRKGKSPVIVYIAKDRPIDQYLVHHPDFITSTPVEQALLNPDNPYILLQHLPCAAQEHPLREAEDGFDSAIYAEACQDPQGRQDLSFPITTRTATRFRTTRRAASISAGMTDYNVEIYCGTRGHRRARSHRRARDTVQGRHLPAPGAQIHVDGP